ncbi:MAG: ABC transporter permease [Fimbriimonas sp.]
MIRYLLRRILYAIPILIGVSLATFALFYLTVPPEQMARQNISAKNPTPQQIEDWLTARGYDRPLGEQFTKHMRGVFLFDFGVSDSTGEPIAERLRNGIGPSALIGAVVLLGSVAASVALALVVAAFRGTYFDVWMTFLCVLLMSVTFLVYIIGGQFLLAKLARWFPLAGYGEGTDQLRYLVLPAIVGIVASLGGNVRFFRTVILEEAGRDYVRTARAKGVGEGRILFGHVLKNAAIPILTSFALSLPFVVMGSLLLESFFGIPGIGTITFDAINGQDFSTVRAVVFLGSILYIVGAILTDLSYALVDPRVRLE